MGNDRRQKIEKGLLVKGAVIQLTDTERVLWPNDGYTKGDMIAYYRAIGPYILPYLKDRLQDGGMVCNDEGALIYLANLTYIEMKTWSARIGMLEYPDYAIFNLEPMGTSFGYVARAALEIKKILDGAGINSYCKTSGVGGLHVLVPTGARYHHGQVRNFVEIIMRIVYKRLPRITSLERRPDERRKRVHLDHSKNGYGQTIIAPYSLQSDDGAPVSAPLLWDEVMPELDIREFNFKTIFDRLREKGDIMGQLLKGNDNKIAVM